MRMNGQRAQFASLCRSARAVSAICSVECQQTIWPNAFKVPFVVENRTGAGGMLGAQQGANAEPDGYTLTLTNVSTLSLVPATNAQTPYDALKDFTHIAYIGGAPASLAVFPGVGAK